MISSLIPWSLHLLGLYLLSCNFLKPRAELNCDRFQSNHRFISESSISVGSNGHIVPEDNLLFASILSYAGDLQSFKSLLENLSQELIFHLKKA